MTTATTTSTALITVIISGEPVAKGRPRMTKRGFTYTPAATRKYEAHGRLAAQLAMDGRPPIEGPVRISVLVELPVPSSWSARKKAGALAGGIRPTSRPDVDNYVKAILDAVNGIVLADDALAVELPRHQTIWHRAADGCDDLPDCECGSFESEGRLMTRQRLPSRRASTTFTFECGPHRYIATVSYFPSGQLAEIFLGNGRAGSDIDAAAKDSAVVCSTALQHSVPVEVIRRALLRDPHGIASSPLGRCLDIIAAGGTP